MSLRSSLVTQDVNTEMTAPTSSPPVVFMPPDEHAHAHDVQPTPQGQTQTSSPPSSYSHPSSPRDTARHGLLPIPLPSNNKSQISFAFADVTAGNQPPGGHFDSLPPDIAAADISIAPDGSFVETSSGPAARELKRRYDQHYGVGKDVRSPYAITAFINQHGKQMFRVGHREMSAPGAAAAEVEEMIASKSPSTTHPSPTTSKQSPPSSPPRAKRRSRISVQMFLHPSTFMSGGSSSNNDAGLSPVSTALSPTFTAPLQRKLRRSRSIDISATPTAVLSPPPQPSEPPSSRTHSQSITSIDMPRLPSAMVDLPRPPVGDIFGDVMHWSYPPPMRSAVQSIIVARETSHLSEAPTPTTARMPAIIVQPFGPGVLFDSPLRRSNRDSSLPTPHPHLLRQMHSFESGMTARQIGVDSGSPFLSPSPEPEPEPEPDAVLDISAAARDSEQDGRSSAPQLAAALDERDGSPSPPPEVKEEPKAPPYGPSHETSVHSRYSTDVFDVLQTYRGLPQLDKLFQDTGETIVIKMSLSADETAAPKDDPRFVIWGEIYAQAEGDEVLSVSHGSSSAHSSSNASKKRKGKVAPHVEIPSVRVTAGEGLQKVLVAATIERWIAQLTSELNYDELLNFFLTYRTYISAVDLCHLLICRFHWALSQPTSVQDEDVRKIVRVRTFVAIRYWLLTFFAVDFLGNRELRLLLASWINALIKDPVLKKHSDGLSTVRKLKRVVQDCKKAHTRAPNKRTSTKARPKASHVLGEKFAEAIRPPHDDDSDVDLDFAPDEPSAYDASPFQTDPMNAHLAAQLGTAGLSSVVLPVGGGPSLTMLQQNRSSVVPEGDLPFTQTAATLPIHHNALSRAFVNTIGRLGRWKRVLDSRSAARTPLGACADVSAFDLELTVARDLLTVNGGVEQYLKMIELQQQPRQPPSPILPSPPRSVVVAADAPAVPPKDGRPVSVASTLDKKPASIKSVPRPGLRDSFATPSIEEVVEIGQQKLDVQEDRSDAASSRSTSSTDSLGVPIASRFTTNHSSQRSPWHFDVVSIDQLDFSDTSSDNHVAGPAAPPGLRKVGLKRLPLRRDFEFVQRPESVSSMGITSHHSVVSAASSKVSGASSTVELGGNIQQWQMNALVDSLSNDGEAGDVEDALRRLEGQINPAKQQEKASKVDGWVRTIRERLAAGDYGDEEPRGLEDDEEQSPDEMAEDDGADAESQWSGEGLAPISPSVDGSRNSQDFSTLNIPPDVNVVHQPAAAAAARLPPSKPVDEAVPLEILQSRITSRPKTFSGTFPPAKFGSPEPPSVHRSFILSYRAAVLVEHFSMIDRELFLGLKFEELVLDDWMNCEEVNVLDWAQFLKDRARWKAEQIFPHKTSGLAAVRARFNLMANFVISEVVLTHPNERAAVVAKLIRMAWKAWNLHNFNILVAIIAGLQSEWVTRAMRRSWNRVASWEMRILKDLIEYTTNVDDFMHIRLTTESMVEAKPVEIGSHTTSSGGAMDSQSSKTKNLESKVVLPSACVPFIGMYLSQLYRFKRMPDLIDPTAPNEAVSIDPETSNFDAPAHPEVFSSLAPLPSSMQLEPLINVHKQRLIASVIKSMVAGQHMASRVQFPIDKKVFQRCLRLRGLDTDTLQKAMSMYPD